MKTIVLLFLAAISSAAEFKHQKLHAIGGLQYQYVHLGIPSAMIARNLRQVLGFDYRLDHNALPLHVIEGPKGLALAAPDKLYDEISRHTTGISFLPSEGLSWQVDYHRRITLAARNKLQAHLEAVDLEEAYEMIRQVVAGPRGWR